MNNSKLQATLDYTDAMENYRHENLRSLCPLTYSVSLPKFVN